MYICGDSHMYLYIYIYLFMYIYMHMMNVCRMFHGMGCNGTNMVGAESRVEFHVVRMTIVAQVVNLPICRIFGVPISVVSISFFFSVALGQHGITRWERFENGRETRRRFAGTLQRCNGVVGLKGISMGYLWDIYGISMGYLWDIYGWCMMGIFSRISYSGHTGIIWGYNWMYPTNNIIFGCVWKWGNVTF